MTSTLNIYKCYFYFSKFQTEKQKKKKYWIPNWISIQNIWIEWDLINSKQKLLKHAVSF